MFWLILYAIGVACFGGLLAAIGRDDAPAWVLMLIALGWPLPVGVGLVGFTLFLAFGVWPLTAVLVVCWTIFRLVHG